MDVPERLDITHLTAAEFLATDQGAFGNDWRYELVDGRIVAHAAPSPPHGEIIVNLASLLKAKLRGHPCKAEAGSGAAPRKQQRPTARIPDVLIRCGGLTRVLFEIVSPSELRSWRARNRKRSDEQDVEGVEEIVEIYEGQASAHVFRRHPDGKAWTFEAVDGVESVIRLSSVGLDLPMAEIYDGIDFEQAATDG